MIEDAIRSAEATSPDPCFDFAPELKGSFPQLPIFDEALEGISEKAKIDKAKDLEASAKAVDPERIKKVRKASYQEVLSRITLVNSNGLRHSYNHSLASASVTAVAEESGESEVAWISTPAIFLNEVSPAWTRLQYRSSKCCGCSRKACDRLDPCSILLLICIISRANRAFAVAARHDVERLQHRHAGLQHRRQLPVKKVMSFWLMPRPPRSVCRLILVTRMPWRRRLS